MSSTALKKQNKTILIINFIKEIQSKQKKMLQALKYCQVFQVVLNILINKQQILNSFSRHFLLYDKQRGERTQSETAGHHS